MRSGQQLLAAAPAYSDSVVTSSDSSTPDVGRHEARLPDLRVKLIDGWTDSETICRTWSSMSEGGGRWIDIEITSDDDADFYVIVNFPRPDDVYRPERTIVLQMEPWCGGDDQHWGVKTWGEWASPDPARFLQVRSHRRFLNTAMWMFDHTYAELRARTFPKTGVLSAVIGGKYHDPGHIKRVDFLRYLEACDDDVVQMHLYNDDNPHDLRMWAGSGSKETAYFDYRYVLAVENNAEHNYISEKLWEPLIAEALPFYWGAPNVADHVDPRAFIPLDLDDFDKALHTVREAILHDEWSRRLEFIRRERRKVLEHHQFFPMLRRILRDDFRFVAPPTDAEVTFHKYFAQDMGAPVTNALFVLCTTRHEETSTLATALARLASTGALEILDRLVVVNFGDEIALPRALSGATGWARVINVSSHDADAGRLSLSIMGSFARRYTGAAIGCVDLRDVSGHDSSHDQGGLASIDHLTEMREQLASRRVVSTERSPGPRVWWAVAGLLAEADGPGVGPGTPVEAGNPL